MTVYKDGHTRSIVKAVSYRVCAAIVTMSIVFAFTGQAVISVLAGLAEAVAKMFFYYIHERAWSLIKFGRKEHPLSSLPVNKPVTESDMDIIKNKLKYLGYLSED